MSTRSIKPYQYKKRKFKYLEKWNINQLQLKIYAIIKSHLPDDFIPPTGEVRQYIEKHLPLATDNEGNCHDLGFVIIHYSQGQIWLLIHWWAHDDICCQIMAHSREDQIKFSSIDHRPLQACIWENKIIHHENQAWIDTILNMHPNPEKYLATKYKDGHY